MRARVKMYVEINTYWLALNGPKPLQTAFFGNSVLYTEIWPTEYFYTIGKSLWATTLWCPVKQSHTEYAEHRHRFKVTCQVLRRNYLQGWGLHLQPDLWGWPITRVGASIYNWTLEEILRAVTTTYDPICKRLPTDGSASGTQTCKEKSVETRSNIHLLKALSSIQLLLFHLYCFFC